MRHSQPEPSLRSKRLGRNQRSLRHARVGIHLHLDLLLQRTGPRVRDEHLVHTALRARGRQSERRQLGHGRRARDIDGDTRQRLRERDQQHALVERMEQGRPGLYRQVHLRRTSQPRSQHRPEPRIRRSRRVDDPRHLRRLMEPDRNVCIWLRWTELQHDVSRLAIRFMDGDRREELGQL